MARTEAQRKARNRYERKQRRLVVTLYDADADIARHIKALEDSGMGYAEYIRGLIREDMKKGAQ